MEGLTILTNIAIILLFGLLCTILSKRLKISNVLLLVVLGIFLRFMAIDGHPLFEFTPVFLISVATLAIVMIVFDSTSRFKWKDLDAASVNALELTGWFAIANLVILSIFAMFFIFGRMSLEYYLFIGLDNKILRIRITC